MDPTSQLRDIYLPEAVSPWPPAFGWWLLAILIIVAAIGLTVVAVKRFRAGVYRRQALKDLKQLMENYQGKNPQRTLYQLSTLMKRLALVHYPRHEVAKLSETAWLQFLDHTGKNTNFEFGPANALSKLRYFEAQNNQSLKQSPDQSSDQPLAQELAKLPMNEVFDTCKQWIKSQR